MCVVRRMFGAQVCSVVRWLFGCGLVGLLMVLIVPLFFTFLAMSGLCCFFRVTHVLPSLAVCDAKALTYMATSGYPLCCKDSQCTLHACHCACHAHTWRHGVESHRTGVRASKW